VKTKSGVLVLLMVRTRFGDIDRDIGDPLQLAVDLDDRDDQAQVAGHRLMEGKDFEAFLLHPDLHVVDLPVRGHDQCSLGLVPVLQKGAGPPQTVLHQGAQLEDHLLQLVDLTMEMHMAAHGLPPEKLLIDGTSRYQSPLYQRLITARLIID